MTGEGSCSVERDYDRAAGALVHDWVNDNADPYLAR
jgi:hypothetical protein